MNGHFYALIIRIEIFKNNLWQVMQHQLIALLNRLLNVNNIPVLVKRLNEKT